MKKSIFVLTILVLLSCNDEKMCGKNQDTMSKDSNEYPCYRTSKTIKY